MSRKRSPKSNYREHAMARALDSLAEYDAFTTEIAPILRQAIKEGWSAERLKSDPKIKTLLLARKLSIALMEKNPNAALAAISDHENRTDGKPTENKNIKMSLENLSDEALDAKLASLSDEGEQYDNH